LLQVTPDQIDVNRTVASIPKLIRKRGES